MKLRLNENIFSFKGLILLFIFLATLNTINRYYYFIFIAFGLFLLCNNRKIIFNTSAFALIVLGVSFIVFSSSYSNTVLNIFKPFTYFMCYVMGYGLYEYKTIDSNETLKPFYMSVVFIVAGPFAHYLLNWSNNFSNYVSRDTIDFWTNSVMSATGQASLASLPLAVSMACLFMDTSKKVKVISIAAIIAILGYNLILSGRTLLVLLLIIGVVAFIHMLYNQKTKRMQSVFVLVIIVCLLLLAYNVNFLGIKTEVESSPLYDRFYGEYSQEIGDDVRDVRKSLYLQNLEQSFFGGSRLHSQFGYAHDIFLDTYDEAGIFALLAMVIYIVSSINRMIKCVTNRSFPFNFRQIVLCVYVLAYLQFMIEPVLQGIQWLFASFCLIDGSLSRIIAYKKRASGPIMR